ncbi:MAG: CPBP family glutamic-type intramembrane protease [Lachnospiraceae bacterium]|nr:CPBP family glutamic-type intramembrane protease [Lachnospiraceae bacterium]
MKNYVRSTLKRGLKTYLFILPFALIGGYSVGVYTMEHSSPEIIESALSQLGSYQALYALTTVQSVLYSLICWIIGYFINDRLGLVRSFRFSKELLKKICPAIFILGILFASDYFIMGRLIPEVAADYEKGISVAYFICSLTYGGVIEEILLRWFFMSVIGLILVFLFQRKTSKDQLPDWIFITANVIAALVFSAGHLPATVMFFGHITPLILFRCFLLNGSFALFFGRWFRKYGIQYAMLGHFGVHLIAKILLLWVL